MEGSLGLIRHSGNDALFMAVEMSLLSTYTGHPLHLHAEGLRGTGKTTVLRAARQVLPRITRIKGCVYNCDPLRPHCPHHRHLSAAEVRALGDERVPMPFLEISHSAKVGTAVGSIDLARLVDPSRPEAALLPGTLVQAHRGIVLVDEINRLAETAPELADVLLDAMGTKPGRVQIEETGMPAVEMSVCVSVWAASNPDEDPGPLEEVRRQLSDRFDFVIPTVRPRELHVVRQVLDGMVDERPAAVDPVKADVYRTKLNTAALRLRQVVLPPVLREMVAELYTRFDLESLRAVQAMLLGMRALAALDNRKEAELSDLARVAPLALQHRVEGEVLSGVMQFLQTRDKGQNLKGSLTGLMAGTGRATPAAPPSTPGIAPGQRLFSAATGALSSGKAAESTSPYGTPPAAPRTADQPSAMSSMAGAPLSSSARAPSVPSPASSASYSGALQAADERPRWWQRILGTYTPTAAGDRRGKGSAAGSQSGAAGATSHSATPPRPGQAFRQAGGQAEPVLVDPARTAVQAPPQPARSILELAEPELVRSAHELKG